MAVRITRSGLGLTVGIIVLALVVLGGLYLVKERGEQARREDAIQVAQEKLESQSGAGVATPSTNSNGNNAENNGTNGTNNSGTATTGENGAATIPGSSAETSTSGSSANGTANGSTNGASANTAPGTLSQTSTATELPQTGLVDTSGALAVGLLTLAIASYVGSRRTLRRA